MRELFLSEFRRVWILFKRYPGEAVTILIIFSVIFLGLFLGTKWVAGPSAQFGERLDAIIVGYILWTLTLYALSSMGWGIQLEAQTGTLEQVCLSPHGPVKVFLVRAVAELLLHLLLAGCVFGVVLLISGRSLNFTPWILLPILTVMMGTYGLGLVLAGMAMVLKRIQNALELSQFILLFLVMTPVETWPQPWNALGYLLPMTPGSALMRNLMAARTGFSVELFAGAVVNGVVYLSLGITFFLWAERKAKQRGLLAGY